MSSSLRVAPVTTSVPVTLRHVDVGARRRTRRVDPGRGVQPGLARVEQAIVVGVADVDLALHHRHRLEVVAGGAVAASSRIVMSCSATVPRLRHLEGEGRHGPSVRNTGRIGSLASSCDGRLARVDGIDRLDDADARVGCRGSAPGRRRCSAAVASAAITVTVLACWPASATVGAPITPAEVNSQTSSGRSSRAVSVACHR